MLVPYQDWQILLTQRLIELNARRRIRMLQNRVIFVVETVTWIKLCIAQKAPKLTRNVAQIPSSTHPEIPLAIADSQSRNEHGIYPDVQQAAGLRKRTGPLYRKYLRSEEAHV